MGRMIVLIVAIVIASISSVQVVKAAPPTWTIVALGGLDSGAAQDAAAFLANEGFAARVGCHGHAEREFEVIVGSYGTRDRAFTGSDLARLRKVVYKSRQAFRQAYPAIRDSVAREAELF